MDYLAPLGGLPHYRKGCLQHGVGPPGELVLDERTAAQLRMGPSQCRLRMGYSCHSQHTDHAVGAAQPGKYFQYRLHR